MARQGRSGGLRAFSFFAPGPHGEALKRYLAAQGTSRFSDPDYSSLENTNTAGGTLLGFGSSPTLAFPCLKFADREVRTIARLLSPKRVTLLKGENANEVWLKSHRLTDYKVIHFATNTLIDDKEPSRPDIVLTLNPNALEDGLL